MERPINLLVVDDDEINTFIIEKMAARTTYPVTTQCFNQGQKILDKLNTDPKGIDIVLMDINMPVVNGWALLEAFSKMKRLLFDIHIYMVSATIYDEDQEKIKQYPIVKGILLKPLSIKRLQEIFDLFVHQRSDV